MRRAFGLRSASARAAPEIQTKLWPISRELETDGPCGLPRETLSISLSFSLAFCAPAPLSCVEPAFCDFFFARVRQGARANESVAAGARAVVTGTRAAVTGLTMCVFFFSALRASWHHFYEMTRVRRLPFVAKALRPAGARKIDDEGTALRGMFRSARGDPRARRGPRFLDTFPERERFARRSSPPCVYFFQGPRERNTKCRSREGVNATVAASAETFAAGEERVKSELDQLETKTGWLRGAGPRRTPRAHSTGPFYFFRVGDESPTTVNRFGSHSVLEF